MSPQHSADAELAEAEQAVEAAASKGLLGGAHSGMTAHKRRALLRSVLEVAAVMFVAEWGDRSMLATVALGAAQVGHPRLAECSAVAESCHNDHNAQTLHSLRWLLLATLTQACCCTLLLAFVTCRTPGVWLLVPRQHMQRLQGWLSWAAHGRQSMSASTHLMPSAACCSSCLLRLQWCHWCEASTYRSRHTLLQCGSDYGESLHPVHLGAAHYDALS